MIQGFKIAFRNLYVNKNLQKFTKKFKAEKALICGLDFHCIVCFCISL